MWLRLHMGARAQCGEAANGALPGGRASCPPVPAAMEALADGCPLGCPDVACLGGCLQRRPAFHPGDRVKHRVLPRAGGRGRPLKGPVGQEVGEGCIHSLGRAVRLLPLDFSTPGSWVFGLGPGPTALSPESQAWDSD